VYLVAPAKRESERDRGLLTIKERECARKRETLREERERDKEREREERERERERDRERVMY
jgi:hypothetical protein